MHSGVGQARQPLGLGVDDHHVVACLGEFAGDRPSHPADAAHDRVALHRADPTVASPAGQQFGDRAVDHGLDHQGDRVQRCTGAEDDQRNSEQLLARAEVLQLAEADGRDSGDGLVERIDEAEPEAHVARGADDEHHEECNTRQTEPPPRVDHA